jgi:tetratricopeptide (TPR) repeat protein
MLSAEHHFHKAESHVTQRRYPEAVRALRKANSLCPDQAEFIAELGWALFLEGGEPRAQEALDELERAIERSPKLDRAYLIRGWVCKALGRIDDAVRDFEQAVLCNPECADAAQELRALRPRGEENR